jgi:DNA repair protein RadC
MKTNTYLPEISLKLKSGETEKAKITSSRDAAELFRKIWDNDSLNIYESFIVLYLNRSNKSIGWLKVSQGGISGTVIDTRLILATGLKCLASGIILAHNHPSGNRNPSEADRHITYKIKAGAKLLDMAVLDHVIITEDEYYSFADEGKME